MGSSNPFFRFGILVVCLSSFPFFRSLDPPSLNTLSLSVLTLLNPCEKWFKSSAVDTTECV